MRIRVKNRHACGILCFIITGLPSTSAYSQVFDDSLQRRFSPTEWFVSDITTNETSNINRFSIIKENFDWSYITFGPGVAFKDGASTKAMYYEAELNQYLNWFEYGDQKKLSIDVPIRLSVRQFHDNSSPVRTPSFNPGVRATVWNSDRSEKTRSFGYATFGLHHYSNGQDANSLNSDGSVNTRNGSFSTDYVELAYYRVSDMWAINWLRLSVREHLRLTWEDFQDRQYERGAVRLQLKAKRFVTPLYPLNWRWPTQIHISGRCSYRGRDYVVYNPLDGSKNQSASLKDNIHTTIEITFAPKTWQAMNWYIRYDYGYDYYNINFQSPMSRLQVGLTGHSFDF